MKLIGVVLRLMSHHDPRRLEGMLSQANVIRAYDIALTRIATLRHSAQQIRLGAINPEQVSMFEITVEAGAPCDG